MKKRLVTLMLAACMMITGCSAGNAGGAEATNAKGAKNEKITFVMHPDDQPMIEALADEFKKEHPNFELNPITISDNYMDKLTVQLSGGSDIDMFFANTIGDYADLVSKGVALKLDDYIQNDSIDLTGYGSMVNNLKYDNSLYGMLMRKSVWVLYYNKDLFDKAGVSYPTGNMSYEEFRELAKAMTSGSGNDKTWGAYVHTWPICWERMAIQSGATVIDEDLSPFIDALQFRLDMESDGSIMPYTEAIATSASYKTEFMKGNLAMHINGDFHIGQLRQAEKNGDINFNWDIVASPIPNGTPENTTTGMPSTVLINSKTKKADIAWEFLKFISGPEGAKVYAKAGFTPAWIDEDVKQIMTYDGQTKPENIGILLEQNVYPEVPAVPGIAQVDKIYNEESQLTFAGEKTAQETIENIKDRISELNLKIQ